MGWSRGSRVASRYIALFVPDFPNDRAYYAIGTKVEHEGDAVFTAYVGQTTFASVSGTGGKNGWFVSAPSDDSGLFRNDHVREFNDRFITAMNIPIGGDYDGGRLD